MSLLSNENVTSAQFSSGIESLNFQEESKVELIFLRLVEHETRITSGPGHSSAFSDHEKQKLVSVLNNVSSVEQVQMNFRALFGSCGIKFRTRKALSEQSAPKLNSFCLTKSLLKRVSNILFFTIRSVIKVDLNGSRLRLSWKHWPRS